MYICALYTQHIILILSTCGFSLCISNVACSFEISSPAKKLKIQTYHPSGSNDLSPDAYAIFPERAGAQWLLCCPMCPRGMCTSQWQPHPYIESPRMSRLLRHAQLVCDRFRFLEGHWKKGSGKSLPRQATSASGRAHCITLQQQSDTSSPSLNTKLSPYVGKGK